MTERAGERASATAVLDIPTPQVSRLRCLGCATRACETLAAVPGVGHVDCGTSGASVEVQFDPERVTEDELLAVLGEYGAQLAEAHRHAAWRVTGLD